MKHKITLTDEEIDSIRTSLGQVISKGITMPELVRLDYKLEKLRQSKQRKRKDKEDVEEASDNTQESDEEQHALPQDTIITITE